MYTRVLTEIRIWLGMLAMLASFYNCKPIKQGSVKSLDNFARHDGVVQKNNCYAPTEALTELEKILPQQDRIFYGVVPPEEFHKVLAAVPTSVLTVFFMFGGKIYLTPEKKSICSQNNSTENTELKRAQAEGKNELVSACWGQGEDGGIDLWINPANNGSGFVEMHHGTVRAFGHMLAEIFLKFKFVQKEMAGTTGGEPQYNWQAVKNESQSEAKYLAKLARTFEAEISLINKGDQRQSRASAISYDLSQYDYLRTGENRRIFEFFVFGEAFDSYYCSPELRADMRKSFPSTYVSIETINQTFTNDTGKTYGAIAYGEKRYQGCLIGCEIQRLATSIPLTSERRPDLNRFYDQQRYEEDPSWVNDEIDGEPISDRRGINNQNKSNQGYTTPASDNSVYRNDNSYRQRTYADQSRYAGSPANYQTSPNIYTNPSGQRGFINLNRNGYYGNNSGTDGQTEYMVGNVVSQAGGLFLQGLVNKRQTDALANSQLSAANANVSTSQPITIGTGVPQGGTNPDGTPIGTGQYQYPPVIPAGNSLGSTSPYVPPTTNNSPYTYTPPPAAKTPPKVAKKSSSTCGVVAVANRDYELPLRSIVMLLLMPFALILPRIT